MVQRTNLSASAIKNTKGRVFRKLGVKGEVELAAILLLPLNSPLRPTAALDGGG